MDDRDLEARLRARLHRRFDDAQPPRDLVAGIEQVFATEPRRVGLALPRPGSGSRLTWSLGAVAVLITVVALAAIGFRPPSGPGGPSQSPSITPISVGPYEEAFIVLPPTSALPSKAETDLASAVMTARLQALGIRTFTGSSGNALQFRIQESGHSEDAIRTVLAAAGDVSFVPVSDEIASGAVVGEPLPAGATPLFGLDGISSVEAQADAASGDPAVTITLKPPAATLFGDYTEANVGATFAVVVDDVVALLPTIQAPIVGGQVTLSAGLDADASFATTAAILVGGVLPEAWRGATAPVLISSADATELARDASTVEVIGHEETSLDAVLAEGEWHAVWNVRFGVAFPSACPPPADRICTVVTAEIIVIDAVTGNVLATIIDPEVTPAPSP